MNNRYPLYSQLSDLIREKIERGDYEFGQAIPSERELAAAYGVNRQTVRSAIACLVKEGLVTKWKGKGSFINKPRIDTALDTIEGFGRFLEDNGVQPSSKVLFTGKRKAGFLYSRIFNLAESDFLYRILRLRLADNEPVSLEDTYIPYKLIDQIETYDFQVYSLYDIFSRHDINLTLDYEKLSIIRVRNPEAKLLNIAPGSSIFLVEDRSVDADGRLVEFTRSYTSGERFTFSTVMI